MKHAEFVEQAGLVFEAEGMPRMAGRILGYLMVCKPAEQSIADLMEALAASNGSISTMTRFLESQGYIARRSIRGRRQDYFTLPSGVAVTVFAAAQKSLQNIGALFARALEINGKNTAVAEARDLFAFLAREYPALLERWQKKQR